MGDSSETFVKTDPLGNPIDKRHPWNQTTIPKPQRRNFADNYTWVMSPRWLDKRTGDHLALDTGGGPIARLWATALAGLVDIGYVEGARRRQCPDSSAEDGDQRPTVDSTWNVPKWSNTIERDRARTYFQAYAAGLRLITSSRRRWRKCMPDARKPSLRSKCRTKPSAAVSTKPCAAFFRITWSSARARLPTTTPIRPRRGTPTRAISTARLGLTKMPCKITPIFEENGPDNFKGIDIMRAVRSFDPCLPCGVHMYLGGGKLLKQMHTPTA